MSESDFMRSAGMPEREPVQPPTESLLNRHDEGLANTAAAAIHETSRQEAFRVTLEEAHGATASLLERIGVTTPELSDFINAGFDLNRLADAHQTMGWLGLEPTLVFAPVLPIDSWQAIHAQLRDDPSTNPGGEVIKSRLGVNQPMAANWEKNQANQHTVEVNGQPWQMLVIPSTEKPPFAGLDYHGHERADTISLQFEDTVATVTDDASQHRTPDDAIHPTLPGYFTLQLARLSAGLPPLDTYPSRTWLSSGIWQDERPEDSSALVGTWVPPYRLLESGGRVLLRASTANLCVAELGIRPTVHG